MNIVDFPISLFLHIWAKRCPANALKQTRVLRYHRFKFVIGWVQLSSISSGQSQSGLLYSWDEDYVSVLLIIGPNLILTGMALWEYERMQRALHFMGEKQVSRGFYLYGFKVWWKTPFPWSTLKETCNSSHHSTGEQSIRPFRLKPKWSI